MTGKAQKAQLHSDTQAVRVPAPLTDQRQIELAEDVVSNEFFFGIRQRQQAHSLGGGENRTTRHAVSFFLRT